jgi:tRNA-dihydrouridine synthase
MEKKSDFHLYFAPLQEATDFVYRKTHALIFGQTDKYFSPYILRQNDGTIKKSHLRDILQENCPGYRLIPQIMAGTSADFLFLARHLCDLGYTEINWNLGCPYPMVTNKGMGSGLLPHPDMIRLILEESIPLLPCRISVKMRSGLNSPDEIFSVIPVLNDFSLSEIILHPRIAKQLYRGSADRELFSRASSLFKHPVVYNGDIENSGDFENCRKAFENVNSWMIGRGILKDPFLPSKIKELPLPDKNEKVETLSRFHDEILFQYSKLLSGSSHLLMRMNKFWSYFCFVFPEPAKAFKRVKKAVNMTKYEIAVRDNFQILRNEEN